LVGTALDNGFHFDAIVHERLHDDRWTCKTTITRAQFQAGSANERQIVALHKFASYGNWAIFQVAERHECGEQLASKLTYSWRQWDLEKNAELERVKESTAQLLFHEDHSRDA